MAVLDIQITNASLADIHGGIAASLDEGSWISTGYLMAEIIAIPLTGWLGAIFGQRRYPVGQLDAVRRLLDAVRAARQPGAR